jgi:hypothetical protein
MPAGKLSQSNTMLYTVLTFVAFFLIAAVCAVIFYIKAEDYKTQRDDIRGETAQLANEKQRRDAVTKIVGKPLKGETILGTMTTYLDEMVSAIIGELVQDTTAAAKVSNAIMKINETMELLGEDASAVYGPDDIDLTQTIAKLKSELEAARSAARNMENRLSDTQDDFDAAIANFRLEEQRLINEKSRFQATADEIQAKYDELEKMMQQSTDDQVRIYMDRLKKTEDKLKQKNMDLLKAQAELAKSNEALQTALNKLEEIKPRPDAHVPAFDPDARIVNIDRQTDVVYLDIGSADHVYRGLTFSVYDRNVPIPEDGKGKAEIEVFHVTETVSAARINTSSRKNPIVTEDIVANLIWDSKTSNVFVVAGDFDFDRDGRIERDGKKKIEQLIERWGGRLTTEVSINTDFVILGTPPRPMPAPSRDQIELDPMIEQRYQDSLTGAQQYDDLLTRANTLGVPVFNQSQFMYLVGYESLAAKSKPL